MYRKIYSHANSIRVLMMMMMMMKLNLQTAAFINKCIRQLACYKFEVLHIYDL